MNDVLISIVIVHFGEMQLLLDCISSITYFTKNVKYEILVVNNDTRINSFENIQKLNKDIIIISNRTNLGFAAANNIGLQRAVGKYVLFLNNDTIFIENTLKKIFDFAENLEGNYLIGCELLNKNLTHQNSVFFYPAPWYLFVTNFMLFRLFPKSNFFNPMRAVNNKSKINLNVDSLMGAFLFAKLKTIKKYGGFDERFFFYHEETDLAFRIKKDGGKIIYYPLTKIIHLGGSNKNEMNLFKIKQRFISIIQFLQKNVSGYKFYLCLFIHYFGAFIRIPLFTIGGMLVMNKSLIIRGVYNFKLILSYSQNKFK